MMLGHLALGRPRDTGLTSRGVEVDLVVGRPDGSVALVELKSKTRIGDEDFRSLRLFASDFPDADFFLLSCDPRQQTSGKVKAMPWAQGIALILGS